MMCRGLIALLLALPSIAAAQWTAELSRDGTATVRYDNSRVLSFNVAAWGPNWKFAPTKTSLGKPIDNNYPVSGDVPALNVTLHGTASWDGSTLTYALTAHTDKPSQGNIGAAFNLALRSSPLGADGKPAPKPQITGDGNGLTWTTDKGDAISVAFDGLARKMEFEKGKTDQARAWFLPPDLTPGDTTVKMTIKLPAGATFRGVPASRYADINPETWLAGTLDWNTSPIDLSVLNDKPAGGHGFVKVDGDHFTFTDGTPIRFWGCNVQAFALFQAKDAEIAQQAKRIAQLGYNLVRIHHHDSADWVKPNVFEADATDTQHLDAAALDRIDYWVKCLKDNGVYVWLDLNVGRPYREGDKVPALDEMTVNKKTGTAQAKGYNYVNPRVTELMKQFAKDYLTRTNRYTGLKYTDDPAVACILITNENDITDHYGNDFLPNKNKPQHKAMYDAIRDPIVKALGLPGDKAWQNWLPGPSKVVLNQVQYDWSKDFVDYLHSIGVKTPIVTTSTWGSDPLFSLPALTAGDVIDVHSYGQGESLSSNPRHDPNSAFWIAAAQVAGKPLTITEWNSPYPTKDRFTQPLYIAALGAFQGWDAPMIFGYQQSPLVQPTKLSEWTTSNDPSITPLMPAAALMFRRGDVSPAKETDVLTLSGEDLLYNAVSPQTSAALRTIPEQHRLVVAMPKTPLLPWLAESPTPPLARQITDPSVDLIPPGDSVTSDTGELKRDWGDGVFTIDTPRSQAAVGWIGGKTVTLGDVTFTIDTPKAAVVVSSLDGEPIASSKKMLLTVAAQTGIKKGKGIVAEPVTGEVTFKAGVTAANALMPNARLGPASGDGTTISLDGKTPTHWFVLTR